MTISHLLPYWMMCERHQDVFRDFRSHDACEVRIATQAEVDEHHARYRYEHDAEYHAWLNLAWYFSRWWQELFAGCTA